jgi:hypothetical protein
MAADPTRRPKANPKAAIQDWLTLVDPDGAFLTPSELNTVFPHGFEQMDRDLRTELRARVADLAEADDPATRSDLRRWLLGTALDWDDLLADGQRIPATATVRAAEHGITLRPAHVLLDADDANRVRLGVFTWSLGTPLDRRTDLAASGDTWPASPVQRAETWCRESGTPLALVTDDDTWTLVWAPRGAPAASGTWTISDLADETILQSGLVSLLGARRFFAVSDEPKTGETLERLFERAADAEAELTKGLGASVRQSVELLVAAISRDHVASDGKVLADVAGTEVYESAVTVLMRLVFLLFAEERRLLPAEDPLWAESYSVLTLRDDLRQAATRDGLDALERRSTAWHRLLATFRAVHGGINHDRLTLPAYGGSLFDPDRFPFLEGRRTPDHLIAGGVDLGPAPDAAVGPGRPVAIDDRTVLAILDSLLTVQVKSGRTKVAQRVSYKALDVEQIGHCYEGLLDHGAIPIDELALGLVGPEGGEPEVTVAELEAFDNWDELCEWLSDNTRCNKKASALAKLLEQEPEGVELARLRVACGHDDHTVERVLPYWGLIRPDLRGLPVVLLPGSMFVTQTSTRRNMGAQYTTKALAEEVVQYALEPLVYEPGPQNEPDQEKWKLKTPAAILDLRVCDPAVGSGAILTAAGRYLADRLVESVLENGPGEGPFASRLHDLVTAPAEEQTVLARREIVDHCLYGVDKNPVAAEMAKLSLWLTTMARERPFTFLDHAIQVGDSLLGITDIDQLRWLHLDPSKRQGQRGFESLALDLRLKEATELARRLREMSVVTVRDAAEKHRLNHQLEAMLLDLSAVADALIGAALSSAATHRVALEARLDRQLETIHVALDQERTAAERASAVEAIRAAGTSWLRSELPDDVPVPWDRACLQWPLAFPEVFLERAEPGFDAVVGNPPFLGGKRISTSFGSGYEAALKMDRGGLVGAADLCAHFFRRASSLLAVDGSLGFLATDRIADGDTRKLGLDMCTEAGLNIYRAWKQVDWPGDAQTKIAKVFCWRGDWSGTFHLDGAKAELISTALTDFDPESESLEPLVLKRTPLASLGTGVYGEGFVVERDWRPTGATQEELRRIRPCLTAADIGASIDQTASRSIIDMGGVETERELAAFPLLRDHLVRTVKPVRDSLTGQIHEERFWRFWDQRPELEEWMGRHERAIAIPRLSKFFPCIWATTDQVIADSVIVVASEDDGLFGVLQSVVHAAWVERNMNLRDKRAAYVVGKCFRTFPFAAGLESVGVAAQRLDQARAVAMRARSVGTTKFYNLFHDPDVGDQDVVDAREAQAALDREVCDAYGWTSHELDHGFHETRQGQRFTARSSSRSWIVKRLLELNHERYAEEVAAGLHDTKAKRPTRKRASTRTRTNQGRLL